MTEAKRTWGVLAALLSAASAVQAETIFLPEAQEIQLALEAGPEHLRSDATVYVFAKDGYRQVRTGTNGFTCFVNRDGNQSGDNNLKPTCWDREGSESIVPIMLRVGELLARSVSAQEITRDIDDGFASGKFHSPRKSGIAYMLRGDLFFDPKTQQITKVASPPHYMIYAPGVSNADIGMPAPTRDGPFALPSVYAGYSGGARTAYIIVVAAPAGAHGH